MATKQKRRRKSKAQRQHNRDKEQASRSVFERADGGDYQLTFGRYKGQKLGSVPWDYQQWLKGVETADLSVRAAQRVARGFGHRKKVGTCQQAKRVARAVKGRKPKSAAKPKPPAPAEPQRPEADYRLRFGRHSGERLGDIPERYLEWLVGTAKAKAPSVREGQAAAKRFFGHGEVGSDCGPRRCEICETEQRGTVCSVCGWGLVSVERTGPVATILSPDDW
jgi:uncharacterized protein (DUF3820 family)